MWGKGSQEHSGLASGLCCTLQTPKMHSIQRQGKPVHRDPGSGCRAQVSERTVFEPRVGNHTGLPCGASLPIAALNVSGCKLAQNASVAGLPGSGPGAERHCRTSRAGSSPRRPAPAPRPRPRGPRPRPTFDARHGGDVAPGSRTRAVSGRPETRGGGQTTPGSARRCTSACGSRGGVGAREAALGPASFLRRCGASRDVWGRSVVPVRSRRQHRPEVPAVSGRGARDLCGIASRSAQRAHFSSHHPVCDTGNGCSLLLSLGSYTDPPLIRSSLVPQDFGGPSHGWEPKYASSWESESFSVFLVTKGPAEI